MTLQHNYSFIITIFDRLLRTEQEKKWQKGLAKNAVVIMNLFSKSLCCVITEPSCQDAPVIVALKKIENLKRLKKVI